MISPQGHSQKAPENTHIQFNYRTAEKHQEVYEQEKAERKPAEFSYY